MMVWLAISPAGVGVLYFIRSSVSAAIYQDVLEHVIHPSTHQLCGYCQKKQYLNPTDNLWCIVKRKIRYAELGGDDDSIIAKYTQYT